MNKGIKFLIGAVLVAGAAWWYLTDQRASQQQSLQPGDFSEKFLRAKIVAAQQFNIVNEEGDMLGMISATPGGVSLFMNDANGQLRVSVHTLPTGTTLTLRNANGKSEASLVLYGEGSVFLKLSDGEGFQAQLGNTSLQRPRTGQTQQTSAASLVLFGKDGKVIWRAP